MCNCISRSHGERLDEKDVTLLETTETQDTGTPNATTTKPNSHYNNTSKPSATQDSCLLSTAQDRDEDIVIEDFD